MLHKTIYGSSEYLLRSNFFHFTENTKSMFVNQKDLPNSPVNMMEVYSRKPNYKGLLDDNDRSPPNQINDSNNEHQQQKSFTECTQMESTAEMKYNKRLKTLIENQSIGYYVSQGYLQEDPETQVSNEQLGMTQVVVQMNQQSTQNEYNNQHCFEQNLNYALPRSEQKLINPMENELRRNYSHQNDLNNATTTYNHTLLQEDPHRNSNDDTIGSNQANDVNRLVQHFNDRLQTHTISRSYNPSCVNEVDENTKSLLTTYQPLLNESINPMHQQCEPNFAKNYQKNKHD